MKLKIDDEFKQICSEIIKENKTDEEWEETQSGDMFQSEHYCGGYEEDTFAFGYFGFTGEKNDKEYWFQISLRDIPQILNGKVKEIEINEMATFFN